VKVHASVVVRPWMVPPGKTPLVVTSVPVGRPIEIFNFVVAPAAKLGSVSVLLVRRALAEVGAKTVVTPPPPHLV